MSRELSTGLSAGAGASTAPLPNAAIRRRLLAIARPVIGPLGVSITLRAVALACGVALLGIGGWAVGTTAQGDGSGIGARAVIVLLVVLSLLKGLARYGEQFAGHLVAFKALALLRVFFFRALEPQAPAAVEGRSTGDLLSRVTKDVDRVEVFFAHTIAPAVTAVLVPVVSIGAFALLVDPVGAALLGVALALVGIGVPLLGTRASALAAAGLRVGRGGIAQHVTDSVQGVREVLAFEHGDRRIAEMGRREAAISAALGVLGRWIAARRGLNTLVIALTAVAELWLLGTRSGGGDLSMLGLGLGLAVGAFGPVLAVEDFAADLQQAYASARRIFEVTDAPPLVEDPAGEAEEVVRPALGAPGVRFERVGFAYPGAARPAVADVSFEAAGGKMTAVVGASGSGKSTLAALLTRCWDVDSGRIEVGGRDVKSFGLAELRAEVGFAAQRPYLFNTSIEGNLRLAAPEADDAEIEAAVRAAALDEVVAGEPDGLGAQVGEMGERLSGGQRQRLALARALLRRPSVLVLDEATSQLDAATERRVLAGVREAAAGRTVIVIAHRLATVEDADGIVVLDAGHVVEQGRWDELVASGGAFAELLAREE